MALNKPSLNELSNILRNIEQSGHYDIYNLDNFYKIMETKSIKQVWYLKYLINKNKYFEAKHLMDSFGFLYK
jgi:hypothetical protein